ncbi:uncharacterized protein [Procambarus clarkii]|uniref:uncharacterized protein n=1 Tax=Procambarus clarkii TaxID=6728 RepID=UPI003743B69F
MVQALFKAQRAAAATIGAVMVTLAQLVTIAQLVAIAQLSTAQSIQISPSIKNGGVTFPLFSPSVLYDQRMAESSATQAVVLPAPHQIKRVSDYSVVSPDFHPLDYANDTAKFDYASGKTFFDTDTEPETSSYSYPPMNYKNQSGRFFTFGSGAKTLDLGLSFIVPFVSIPTSSLLNIGENLGATTSTALSSLMSINWASIISIGALILIASLLLPQLAAWVSTLISGGTGGYSNSYGRNIERDGGLLPVAPFTSILSQLDDALAQYDLDSTSCMQRSVCTYVAESELSVKEGDADSIEMIVSGLARSLWLQTLVGKTSLTEAMEMGRSGANCQVQYPKCPFSLTGVLRFLATYASLNS